MEKDAQQLAALEMRALGMAVPHAPVGSKGAKAQGSKGGGAGKIGGGKGDGEMTSEQLVLYAKLWMQHLVEHLPEAWAMIVLSRDTPLHAAGLGGGLTIARLERDAPARFVRREGRGEGADVRGGGIQGVLDEFQEIMKFSRAGLENGAAAVSTDDKKKWWADRAALDRRLEALVLRVENDWFEDGGHLPMLLGCSRGRPSTGSQHLVLVLDEDLQEFPWEALPSLATRSVSR